MNLCLNEIQIQTTQCWSYVEGGVSLSAVVLMNASPNLYCRPATLFILFISVACRPPTAQCLHQRLRFQAWDFYLALIYSRGNW